MAASAPDTKNTMDLQRLARLLDQKAPVVVLDVRPTSEREEWHIPGSLYIDAYESLKEVDRPDGRPIETVCGAGSTSLTAAEQLRSRGKWVVSLEGGMKAWSLAFNTAVVPHAGPRHTGAPHRGPRGYHSRPRSRRQPMRCLVSIWMT